MTTKSKKYPARLDIGYPTKLSRLTTFFRGLLALPILILFGILTGAGIESTVSETGETVAINSGGIAGALFFATLLMILFRKVYPRWWFNFVLELSRFSMRINAYLSLLTDRYPSTVDKQSVHLDIDYPDAQQTLKRGMPLVKWFLAIPHFVVLFFLSIGVGFAIVIAWFAILFTGRYPKGLFNFVVGANRWSLRVSAYAFLLATDEYPPFSLK